MADETKRQDPQCTFCKKPSSAVRKIVCCLVCICDECNAKFLEALRQQDTLKCNFCGKAKTEVRTMFGGPTEFICDECIELIADIVREESKQGQPEEPPVPPA